MSRISIIALITTLGTALYSTAVLAVSPVHHQLAAAEELPLIPLETRLFELPLPMSESQSAEMGIHQSPRDLANHLARGLLVANRSREIGYRSSLSYRVQNVIRRLRRGESITAASQRSGVSQTTIQRLLTLSQDPSAALAIAPDRERSYERYRISHAYANAIVRGLLVANRTGEIGYTAPLSYRIQDVVWRLRRGQDLAVARASANVPDPVVGRLLQLGNYTATLTE